ncbi:putative salicylate hydroxylase [Podospora fimiseda]|uniref:Salicylate hydroxylase n=1 Tax=Podospora fimiseda TaxID=252190 RepID=A0AAN7GUN5_9PEZI|nr:putative salicylate hydroxylase [Podospora fimiseda]
MGSNTPTISIAIIGGGIAGLSLAAGLIKKPHLDIHIYEAVPQHKDVGAGLALHRNAIKAMSLIGPEVYQAYLDKAIDISSEADEEMATQLYFGQGPHAGELVAELGRAKGRKSVSRADLLAGFLELIPKDRITFGKKVSKVCETNENVQFEFTDGTKHSADCLLGADGIHSVIRAYLLGDDHPATDPKNHDGWQVFRTLVSAEEARKKIDEKYTRTVPIFLGPRGHVNCIPMNKGTRLSAGVAVRGIATTNPTGPDTSEDKSSNGAKMDPSLYSDYHPDVKAIVDLVAADTSASWSVGDHDHAPFYAKSRVAMLGDAAHASLPFAGNGAAQALEDAAVLDHLFDLVKQPGRIEDALDAYDAVRRPRSQFVVDLARKFGRVYAYAEGDIHEDPEKLREMFDMASIFTNEVDLRKHLEQAERKFADNVRGRSSRTGAGGGNE